MMRGRFDLLIMLGVVALLAVAQTFMAPGVLP